MIKPPLAKLVKKNNELWYEKYFERKAGRLDEWSTFLNFGGKQETKRSCTPSLIVMKLSFLNMTMKLKFVP